MSKKAVPYYRVSTSRQGQSGLGLDAQRQTASDFTAREQFQVIKEFTEIESGKRTKNRPQLLEALQLCKKEKATLIIAKLDRLGRNVAFIANLMESGVDFVAVDNPQASPLVLHIMAAFAQHEREQISTRTKDALQAAKRRGAVLGHHGRHVLSRENKATAGQFAKAMESTIQELKTAGFTTVRAITDELNKRQIPTAKSDSQKWHVTSVQRLLKRI